MIKHINKLFLEKKLIMSRSHIADTESKNPDKVKKLPVKKPAPKIEEKSLIPPNQKPKIIENSEIISKENQDMIIYKYPNYL